VFTRLPESNARPQKRVGGLVVSTTLHLVIIALAVRATGLTAAPRPKTEAVPTIFLARRPAPPTPPTPRRAFTGDPSMPTVPGEAPPVVSIDTNIIPGIPESGAMAGLMETAFDSGRVSNVGQPSGSPNVSDGSPMLENQVEKAVIAIPGTATPRYPAMLQSAGLEGDVRAQFVVDTLGRVEQGSVRTLDTTHDLFAAAVREALTRARFRPAEVGGHKVRQLVEQTFTFRITR
jgi:protein TonB